MNEEFKFYFSVKKVVVIEDAQNIKEVLVHAKIKKGRNVCLENEFPVRITEIGIFPVPKAIAERVEDPILRRILPFELKRYIKPQKRFLEPGDYS
ncbi:diaminopimelate epimerase [Rossellomorea vietnamensis]|uniref:Diaminopimelate epimerase n=1 Tax=Rossellomorea vietnamensis TaxID=218284 RepID=A0A5D4MIZ9_9BACI|nr:MULTISPECIES: diaminopimelate epimerase [Bacillaceae]TYS01577.1 diaminopimelate epimerase [Rossellomorea vietnamensis]